MKMTDAEFAEFVAAADSGALNRMPLGERRYLGGGMGPQLNGRTVDVTAIECTKSHNRTPAPSAKSAPPWLLSRVEGRLFCTKHGWAE